MSSIAHVRPYDHSLVSLLALPLAALVLNACAGTGHLQRPNVILVMSDDQGYGDVGFRGHQRLRTPNLDDFAQEGIRFERFYAAAPVCSPTRGSCLTGRHPYRYGIRSANVGHMPSREQTLAEILRQEGYRTGHFGKWHLGTLTKSEKDSNRGGPRGAEHYAPPWEHGFDVCFSTEAKVPTFDPMRTPAAFAGGVGKKKEGSSYGTAYWTGPGSRASSGLEGDDSRIIMDRALPFIEGAAERGQPFLAVIWFHAPHLPVVAGLEHLAPYADVADQRRRHYYGCITALDQQFGRLRQKLQELGVAEDTMLWFCSDNGPEGRTHTAPGSSGGLRGRKRSLFEGGIRVPAAFQWPAGVSGSRVVTAPCSTSDYLPTILEALGLKKDLPPLDGINLLPILRGRRQERGNPIGFQSGRQAAWITDRYKLVRNGGRVMLFDIVGDPGETTNLSGTRPELAEEFTRAMDSWCASFEASADGSSR